MKILLKSKNSTFLLTSPAEENHVSELLSALEAAKVGEQRREMVVRDPNHLLVLFTFHFGFCKQVKVNFKYNLPLVDV